METVWGVCMLLGFSSQCPWSGSPTGPRWCISSPESSRHHVRWQVFCYPPVSQRQRRHWNRQLGQKKRQGWFLSSPEVSWTDPISLLPAEQSSFQGAQKLCMDRCYVKMVRTSWFRLLENCGNLQFCSYDLTFLGDCFISACPSSNIFNLIYQNYKIIFLENAIQMSKRVLLL